MWNPFKRKPKPEREVVWKDNNAYVLDKWIATIKEGSNGFAVYLIGIPVPTENCRPRAVAVYLTREAAERDIEWRVNG